ncbi:hypothetical protein GCM10025870_15810 [Agromyces marinus]|uniref:Secreted protein n=1 Tax=Agromyces marinus TaxID=1389020 RepID=A0ABM8H162_9MICO|nr:hypothetical protein GCM10025870_15810 [Agromyces marinus]
MLFASVSVSSTGSAAGGVSNGKPMAVMLDAVTIVRMPARAAAWTTLKLAVMFVVKVVASGTRPLTGIAARCTMASSPA